MNKKQKITEISNLVRLFKSNSAYSDLLYKVWGISPESRLNTQIDKNFSAYMKAVSLLTDIGVDVLEWFLYDNECGGKGLNVYVDNLILTINNVKDFVECEEEILASKVS